MKLNNIKLGADIEVFVKYKDTNEIISAEGYIPGDKWNPHQFDQDNPMFAVSLDNVLGEFCIPPAQSQLDWIANIRKSLNYMNAILPEGMCTVAQPSAILDPKWLDTPNAKKFGCMPDYNAWLKNINPSPKAKNTCLRSGGGHIHTGYDDADELGMEVRENIVKAYDLFIGVPSVIQEPDNERKLLYGKAGAFRDKPYGVEYRTPSNYYLQSDELLAWVYSNCMLALQLLQDDFIYEIEQVAEQIQTAINTCNKTVAGNLIRMFNIPLV